MSTPARSRGFTLIELMVTVTIIAILAGFAIPSYRTFVANQKVKTASFELMASVMMARSEAIKRNLAIDLTPEVGGWQKGWTLTVGGTIVHRQQAELEDVTIKQKDATKTDIAPQVVQFGPSGRPTAGAYFEITVPGQGDAEKCVKLDQTGIPSSTKGKCL